MIYFTADTHFCDERTMKSDFRPFKRIKDFDNTIIKDWNKTAKKGDTIYVAGDLIDCNGPDTTEWIKGLKLVKRVKADIVLIIGNNEQRVIDFFFDGNYDNYGIKEVHKSLDIKINGKMFHIVHQIVDGDEKKINLFGHTHLCSGLYHPYGLCVSTDLNHFRLFTTDQIFSYLRRKHDFWEPDWYINYVNPFLKDVDGKIVNIKQKNNKHFVSSKYNKCSAKSHQFS